MKLYVAGGAVRDAILGRPIKDIDISFDCSEEEFIQRNPEARKVKGQPSPIYILDGNEFSPLAAGKIASDLLRRDFTINSMLLEESGVVHAHPYAFTDLTGLILRPTTPCSILDDPVRAFRAARLTADIPGLTLHQETIAQMRSLTRSALESIAPEQVGKETMKAMASEIPGNFLKALDAGGCLSPWFEEFLNASSIPAGPPKYHKYSILGHITDIMDRTAKSAKSSGLGKDISLAVWMALCHDIGKTTTPPDVLPKHIGHEVRGEAMAAKLGERLRLPSSFIKAGSLSSSLHMKAGIYSTLRPGTKVDLLMNAHSHGVFTPLFLLAAEDSGRKELPGIAQRDLEIILQEHLPVGWQNRGPAAGRKLREMRCEALANNTV